MLAAATAALPACGDEERPQRADRTERFERTPLNRPAESDTSSERACGLVRPRALARLVRRPGAALEPHANDSTDLSICDWRGAGMRVQLIVDSAPRAQLRYYNQLSEQLQFYNSDPQRRPYQLKRVGDDSAYGGAGAWWTPTKAQLVAYADERIVRIRVVARGVGDAAKRRAAVRLGRLVFRRLRA